MADLKITQLANTTTVTDAMLIPTVVDPAGTPVTEKRTVGELKAHILSGPVLTGTTDADRLDFKRGVGDVGALGALGAAETFDWATGTNFTGTLDANITIDFSNAVSGQTITLALAYDGTAQRTLAFTPTIKWGGGVAPVAPDATGEVLVITIKYVGTTYYGSFEIFS